MATLPPDGEPGSIDARIYLEGGTTDPASPLNGNVQHVLCVVQPALGAHSGAPTLVQRVGNLLEAVFPTKVKTVVQANPHYEIRNNENVPCFVCTSMATYEVTLGADTVVVELRESVHYT